MKIVYSYIFQVTNVLKRSEIIPYVRDFIGNHQLHYRTILFDLHTFKLQNAKRKTYLEKLAESNSFWTKAESPCAFDKLTNKLSLLGTHASDEAAMVTTELKRPMSEMPKTCSYTICFDGVEWFEGCAGSEKADLNKHISPRTSNITLYNYAYDNTSYISLNFLMNESGTEHRRFVDLFSAYLSDLPYRKEIDFVPEHSDRELLQKASEKAKQLLDGRGAVDIPTESKASDKKAALKLKNSIQKAFHDFHFVNGGNGVYEVWKTDAFRNQLMVVFDYDRENHAIMATLFYVGAGIKSAVHYSEVQDLYDNDTLLYYMRGVRDDVDAFERSCSPELAEYYPKLPTWFEW